VTPLSGPKTGAERTRAWRERLRARAAGEPVDGEVTGVRMGSGLCPDGSWVPQFDGQRPPFQPGNTLGFQPGNTLTVVHGARSERAIVPRAQALMTAVLEDADCPEYVRSAMFRFTLTAWARAEAIASLMYEYLTGLDPEQMITPKKVATKAPIDLWRIADGHAARLRAELGLSPVSYARIAKDLGLAGKSAEEALGQMARNGREIRERRAASLRAAEDSDSSEGEVSV
jgi:hypothetical protein